MNVRQQIRMFYHGNYFVVYKPQCLSVIQNSLTHPEVNNSNFPQLIAGLKTVEKGNHKETALNAASDEDT